MNGDQAIGRAHTVNRRGGRRPATPNERQRRLTELQPAQALALLETVVYGRVVFTQGALPAIRSVNHLIDAGRIIIRTRLTARISSRAHAAQPIVVAYQADQLDPAQWLGWSVEVTGLARPVTSHTEITRLQNALTPWVDTTIDTAMDTVLAIHPEIITGYRLAPAT